MSLLQSVRRLLSPILQPAPLRRTYRVAAQPNPVSGINVVGYFRAELGIAEVARQIVRGVDQAAIPHSTLTYQRTSSRQEHPFELPDTESAPFDTNIICVNADELSFFRHDVGDAFFRGRYSIGVWFWELARFPQRLHPALALVDEVWVASDFVRRAIAAATPKRVCVVPLPVGETAPVMLSRDELDLPGGFLFLFTFDFLSVFERKNPLAVVHAFKRAFRPGEGAVLLIKTINGKRDAQKLRRLRAEADWPDIHVVDGYVSASTLDAIIAACDCYVSLHRSEGYGLTMAEAMTQGKPVIATGYSGNLEFMNEQNSYLVPFRPIRLAEQCGPYPAGEEWAEPDIDSAAELMRFVYEDRESARTVGRAARDALVSEYTLERTAAFIGTRFGAISHERRDKLA